MLLVPLRNPAVVLVVVLLLGLPGDAAGQETAAAPAPGSTASSSALRTLRAHPRQGPIRVDGRLDEEAWRDAETATDFVQSEPRPGAPASERTVARVLYDGDALWVGVRLHDSSPDSIVARLARRDEEVYSDWIWVGIDSYFDRRTAFGFGLNAAGVRADLKVSDDDTEDESWDAVWDGTATVDAGGWSAEFRIPLSQLRFSGSEAAAGTWGINFQRVVARREETSFWSPVPNDAGVFVSRFGELRELRGLEVPRRVELMPYTVGSVTRAPGAEADPFHEANALSASAGADLRMGVGSGLTLSATFNPDFGQVEADPSVVNLTAFETFFSERRPFFVEGADLFRSSGPRLFYSRRIGRSPQAAPPRAAAYADVPDAATILGAAKLSGKTAGGWSVGVLGGVTAREEADYVTGAGTPGSAVVEPGAGYAAARVARDLNQGRTTVGGIVTATHRSIDDSRLDFLRGSAITGGAEGRHRFAGDRYELSASVTGSHVRGDSAAILRTQTAPGHYFQRPGADHLTLDPSRTSLSGASAQARVAKVGGGNWRWSTGGSVQTPGFEVNDLGFDFGNDRAEWSSSLRYVNFRPGGDLRSWSLGASQFTQYTLGGERLELNGTLEGSVEWMSGWGGRLWVMRHQPGVDPDALRGGPALRQPGRWMGSVSAHSDRRDRLGGHGFLYLETEDETGGYALHGMVGATARPSPRSEVSLNPVFTVSRNPWQYVTRGTVAEEPHWVMATIDRATVALTARASYTFTPDLSLQVYAQPFVGTGDYAGFKTVVRPDVTPAPDQFRPYGPGELGRETAPDGSVSYAVDGDGDGVTDFSIPEPDFSLRQLRSNVVLRWEYRPGSTLFLVWSQDRTSSLTDPALRPFRDLGDLLGADGTDVFLVKLSYWIGG